MYVSKHSNANFPSSSRGGISICQIKVNFIVGIGEWVPFFKVVF